MVKKLYLDGCSLTYGQGLPRNQSLGHLFADEGHYMVKDLSRPAKSNLAIAVDTYKHYEDFDTFVLGFTYSTRFGIKYQNENLDFFSGFHGRGIEISQNNENADQLNDAYLHTYKYFMTTFGPPYCDDLSNMIVDSIVTFLLSHNKKVLAFSWEPRQVRSSIHYPYIGSVHRLDDGHLNYNGTRILFDFLQKTLDE